MNIKSLAESIHKSNRFGVIYEQGAGVGITHNLMQYAGASKTIYASHSLYSKKAFIEHFKIFYVEGETKIPRAVSKEYCDLALQHSSVKSGKVNFELISSFQLPDELSSSKHGWIGYHDLNANSVRFYHLTFPSNMSRKEAIDEVALTGLNIINSGNEHCLFSSYIDKVENRSSLDLELTLQAFSSSKDRSKLALFTPTLDVNNPWKVERIEESLRRRDNILVYKGSFNPWHVGHSHAMEKSVDSYPPAETQHAISISIDTYGKGEMTTLDLLNRLNSLRDIGFPIIVTTKPYFSDLTELIVHKVKGTLMLTMGDDVMDKIIEMNDSYIFLNRKISGLVIRRHNNGEKNYNQIPGVVYIDEAYPKPISSTQIRNERSKD